VTIEAIGKDPVGRVVQDAWFDKDVVQCGYCQSGQIMTAVALLKATPHPTDRNIEESMGGTCAAAAPTCVFAKRSRAPRDTSAKGALMARAIQVDRVQGLTRRSFLRVSAAELEDSGFRSHSVLSGQQKTRRRPVSKGLISRCIRSTSRTDGGLFITVNRVELGQGVATALR